MKYFVIMPDGQKFGPADVDVLTQWAHEGRINSQTMLEDAATGQRAPASSVPGIMLPLSQSMPELQIDQPVQTPMAGPGPSTFEQPPGYTPYQRAEQYGVHPMAGQNEIIYAWVAFGLSLVACGCIGSLFGISFAKKAQKMGNPAAKAPLIANYVSLGLNIVGIIIYAIVIVGVASSGGRGGF